MIANKEGGVSTTSELGSRWRTITFNPVKNADDSKYKLIDFAITVTLAINFGDKLIYW